MSVDLILKGRATGVRCLVRTGRAGSAAVNWSEPREAALYLQRDRQGRLCGLALMDVEFAEFDPRNHCEAPNLLVAEDYYLEIAQVLG